MLVGIADTDAELDWMLRKCLELRLFADENGGDRWQKSLQKIGGELLVVSQFTLYGDCRKGRRPSFDLAITRSHIPHPQLAQSVFTVL